MSIKHISERRGKRSAVFPTQREVLLARLLLQVADRLGAADADQEFLELYNEVKSIAEGVVRGTTTTNA